MNVVVGGWRRAGKTTVSSLLARALAADGFDVLAIHTGQPTILARTLGLGPDVGVSPLPVDLLERVRRPEGATDLELAKSAQEIVNDYGVETAPGLRLLSLATFDHFGTGCTCSGHVTVRKVLSTVVQDRDAVTVIDDIASLGQLQQTALDAVDVVLVVVEPHDTSLAAGRRVIDHAGGLGIHDVRVLGNKVRDDDHRTEIEAFCATNKIALEGIVPFDAAVDHRSDGGTVPLDADHEAGAVATIQTVAADLLAAFAPDQRSRRPSPTE